VAAAPAAELQGGPEAKEAHDGLSIPARDTEFNTDCVIDCSCAERNTTASLPAHNLARAHF